jgi:TrmH family RNA methyltransferase
MISKNKIKQLKSLASKKVRQKERLFLVEGDKNVNEVLNSDYIVNELYATDSFLNSIDKKANRAKKIYTVNTEDINKISLLSQPQNSLALCSMSSNDNKIQYLSSLALYLDGIQDPGNMGTIIRICDWFGIEQLFCSPNTVELYNPKVIQASMGSFCRVKTVYIPFNHIFEIATQTGFPVYGACTEGKNIYTENLPRQGLIVLGNEGNGISDEVKQNINLKLSIPSFNRGELGAESLNVAIAAGIICSEFKRRELHNSTIQSENKG